jgi:hypothetical protein
MISFTPCCSRPILWSSQIMAITHAPLVLAMIIPKPLFLRLLGLVHARTAPNAVRHGPSTSKACTHAPPSNLIGRDPSSSPSGNTITPLHIPSLLLQTGINGFTSPIFFPRALAVLAHFASPDNGFLFLRLFQLPFVFFHHLHHFS